MVKGEIEMLGYWNRQEDTKKTIKDGWLYTGEIGEIDPSVSSEFELRVPIHGGELDISNLITCLPDPVRN